MGFLLSICCIFVLDKNRPMPDNTQTTHVPLNFDLHRKVRGRVAYAEGNRLYLIEENDITGSPRAVAIRQQGINREFDETIDLLREGSRINLVDVAESDGVLIPRYLILEPDYLVDVSALADCFQEYGTAWQRYFYSRLKPKEVTAPILLGNAANLMLDEWVNTPEEEEVSFEKIVQKFFTTYPIELSVCPDINRDFFAGLYTHFQNLRRVVRTQFASIGIRSGAGRIEPTFICEPLGLQGRLDFLQSDGKPVGIELKSGKAAYPEQDYSLIAQSHRAQFSLYQLMIQLILGVRFKELDFYVLYSRYTDKAANLRLSKPQSRWLREILNVRNHIVAADRDAANGDGNMLSQLTADRMIERPSTFTQRYIAPQIDRFNRYLQPGPGREYDRLYFERFYTFVVREHFLTKTGKDFPGETTGITSLWQMDEAEKISAGEMLSGMKIRHNGAANETPEIVLSCTQTTDGTAPNFRPGDRIILYECNRPGDSVQNRQLFKGTIAVLSSDEITIRLGERQRNTATLPAESRYAIEHDFLDASFTPMYKGLYQLMTADERRRGLLLNSPEYRPESDLSVGLHYTDYSPELAPLLRRAMQARDFFLLVGPPGTGKTSHALRGMVREAIASGLTVLLVAFTNRAVDEICEVLEQLDEAEDYLRIGHELSCAPAFRKRILSNVVKEYRSRDEVKRRMSAYRIYTATLSSLCTRTEIFALCRFDLAIIDEASQILEPQLVGLLSAQTPDKTNAIGKFILIGDHKQLPAIVLQNETESKISVPELQERGFSDCRMSLFERMYRNHEGDDAVTGMLCRQWRMHPLIADFPNRAFYGGSLNNGNAPHQTEGVLFRMYDTTSARETLLATRRTAFIPSKVNADDCAKTNRHEAVAIADCVSILRELHRKNGMPFDAGKQIGIIAPFRNQIALIRKELEKRGLETEIRVDTVERFQGSQNDIILYSVCANSERQLESITNCLREGKVLIDRKLNVAMTRARKQLFVFGCPDILRYHPVYLAMMEQLNR